MTRRGFSRRDALCASALQGPTDGKDLDYRRRLCKRPVVEWEYTRTGLGLHNGRAEPAPPRGASRARMALRRKARGWRGGGFLGGTHSVRPHCQAVPKPRHNIINGGKGNARGSSKVIPRWKQSLIYGRAEPAPPRGASLGERPCGGRPGDGAEGVFSEGRTLCVRTARPYPNRGTT